MTKFQIIGYDASMPEGSRCVLKNLADGKLYCTAGGKQPYTLTDPSVIVDSGV